MKKETDKSKKSFLHAMSSAFTQRMKFFKQAGLQYGTDRDLYQALGYKQSSELTYADYFVRYDRQDIAKAVIDRPVGATWRGGITVVESDDKEETTFEKAWDELYQNLSLQSIFTRADKLTSIGEYGVLLLGLSDVSTKEDFRNPVSTGNLKLNFVKPLSEESAVIKELENSPASERFGKPLFYEISLTDPNTNASSTLMIHYTRVIHIAHGLLESEIFGTPRLKPILNRLYDLEKIVGGSGEMFWRGARPGYQGVLGEDFTITDDVKADLQDQIDEYEHNLRRMLINPGVDFKALAMQISDPKNHVDIQIQMISAETGIPKRILTGSERGELSSQDDKDSWNELITSRRDDYAEPLIVVAFIDKMISYKILPDPKEGFDVKWVDLWAPSEKEQAEIGKTLSEALSFYTQNIETMAVIPPKAFLRHILGISNEKIEMILEEQKNAIKIEEGDFGGEE